MSKDVSTTNQENLIEVLHWEIQDWKSQFQVVDEELIQLEELVHSGGYQPNILNLFERLQDYKHRLVAFKTSKCWLRNAITRHESQMGNMEMDANGRFEQDYYRKHDKLRTSVEYNLVQFHQLKLEIVNYTEGLPKKHTGTRNPDDILNFFRN